MCGARREPVPAVDVDRDEDRLQEEEDPLDRERDPEGVAESAREPRPQQPQLEREDRPADGADGDQHRDRLRPVAGETRGLLVVSLAASVLGDQHHRREGDAEAREHDVEPEGEAHLAACRQQVG